MRFGLLSAPSYVMNTRTRVAFAWTAFECWPKNLHMGLRNTLNNKSIKGKLQTILDLIV